METKNNLTGIDDTITSRFAPKYGVSAYSDLISSIETQEKVQTLMDSIDYIKDDTYYNIERFKGCLKRCEKTYNYEFLLNYIYFYKTIKNWKLGTCVRAMNVYLKYQRYIDFSRLSIESVFHLFTRVKATRCSEASRSIDWRKLRQMIKFAGFPYDMGEFHIPEPQNLIKPEQLLSKEEFDSIIDELGKHQYGKGFEFMTFLYIVADTGCRTTEVLSISKNRLSKRRDGYYEIVVVGKTGERNVILYHSTQYIEKLINLGWCKWSFDYYAFYRQLTRVCKRLGITKRVYNHLLRHGFGSFIAEDNTVSLEVKNHYCGWSPRSRTLETTYAHFNQRKVIEMMKPVLERNPLFNRSL